MAINVSRYVSFFTTFKVPIYIWQRRKPIHDRELNDAQWIRVQDGWRNNCKQIGEDIVKEGYSLTINGSDDSIIDVSPFECIFADGVASYNDKIQTLDVASLAAGTYDIVASVTYTTIQSDVDADLKDPTYGQETTAAIEQILTLSLLASTPENKTQDTTLSVSGSTGSGATLRYKVKSTNAYDSNRFSLGCIELPSGQRWSIEDQQDNTPLPGETTFVIDPGPNQSGLAFTVGVGGYLVPPNPIYGPVRTSAVRYIKLGEVVVVGTPPASTIDSITLTADTYKSSQEMRTAFVEEHYTDGTHGPNVTITADTGDALTLDTTSGNDIVGSAGAWSVDNIGNAVFATLVGFMDQVQWFSWDWASSSAAVSTGALPFTPRLAIAFFNGYQSNVKYTTTSIGLAIGAGILSNSLMWSENSSGDANEYGSALVNDAIAGRRPGTGVHTTAEWKFTVTSWSAAGIILTPSISMAVGHMKLLVIG